MNNHYSDHSYFCPRVLYQMDDSSQITHFC